MRRSDLYVMPAASLITDAKARNRVFEEVLRFNMVQAASTVVVPVPDLTAGRIIGAAAFSIFIKDVGWLRLGAWLRRAPTGK